MAKKASGRAAKTAANASGMGTPEANPDDLFTQGDDTSDLPDTYFPELRLNDGESALVRFVKFKFNGKVGIEVMRGQTHSVPMGGNKFRRFTCAGETCALCSHAGLNPGNTWFRVALLRDADGEFNKKRAGQVLLCPLPKRAVVAMQEMLYPNLPKGKTLYDVDVVWTRRGKKVDSQHFFKLAKTQRPLTPTENTAIKGVADIYDIIKPQPSQRLMAVATRLAASSNSGGLSAETAETATAEADTFAGFDAAS